MTSAARNTAPKTLPPIWVGARELAARVHELCYVGDDDEHAATNERHEHDRARHGATGLDGLFGEGGDGVEAEERVGRDCCSTRNTSERCVDTGEGARAHEAARPLCVHDRRDREDDKEENGEDVRYFAKVKKDRTNVTKVGQIIENPSYDIWKDYFEGRSNLETNKTSYKNDIKNSTESMEDKADRSEELAAEFKEVLKSLKDDKDALLKVNKLLKDKGIDLKKLELQLPETLTELIDFAKLQLS